MHHVRTIITAAVLAAGVGGGGAALAQTPSELCADAPVVHPGVFQYTGAGADKDGVSTCGEGLNITDRWVRYHPVESGPVDVTLSGPCTTIVSIHTACPGTAANTVACGVGAVGPASVNFTAAANTPYLVRLVNVPACSGAWTVTISGPPVGRGFTYQGRLKQNGAAVSGPTDLTFSLWTQGAGGTQVGAAETVGGVPVNDGLFTIELNRFNEFGASAFDGSSRWLEIAVRSPAGSGPYTTLSPRQHVTPAPLATRAVSALGLSTPGGSPGNALFVADDGRIGIGMSNPAMALHVAPSSGIYVGPDPAPGGTRGLHMHLAASGASAIEAIESAGATWGNLLLNRFGGNVGIGTQAPENTLHVHSSLTDVMRITGPGAFQSDARVRFQDDTGNVYLHNDVDGGLLINVNAGLGGGGRLAVIGGNVGIGTTAPGFTLAVNGSAAKPGGGGWSVLSDERLKRNTATVTGALERLLRLRGVTFEYNEEGLRTDLAGPGVHIGLIAQEVERVFPEWVAESSDGHKFITEQGVTALLVEALRDLRREKDAEIADLRGRLERLEAADHP